MMYYLINNLIFYVEKAIEVVDGWLTFDAKKTLLCVIRMKPGMEGFEAQKMSDSPGRPTEIKVPLAAVVMVKDVTDSRLRNDFKATISGLHLVGDN